MNEVATSPVAQIIISTIPIVGILVGGFVVFFFLLWKNEQTKLILKTDNYKPPHYNIAAFSLLTGILLTAVGFVLSLLFMLIDGLTYSLLGGLIPLALGSGFIIFYNIYKPKDTNHD
ncbi:MAG TPA: hypothetical protein VFC68_03100 [Treponemataceae bacterium]|nr:hypothetical protein [Treponemataceae bacterium]